MTLFWKLALCPSSGQKPLNSWTLRSSYSQPVGTTETLTSVDKLLRTELVLGYNRKMLQKNESTITRLKE
jgi:hypothetical protein